MTKDSDGKDGGKDGGKDKDRAKEPRAARDPKITPITRHEPRTFYATRVTRTPNAECWDLWAVEDGRRVGFMSVVDDGHVAYALAAVKRGTSHDEVADLVEGFFTPSATDSHNREIIISDYDKEPDLLESEIREG